MRERHIITAVLLFLHPSGILVLKGKDYPGGVLPGVTVLVEPQSSDNPLNRLSFTDLLWLVSEKLFEDVVSLRLRKVMYAPVSGSSGHSFALVFGTISACPTLLCDSGFDALDFVPPREVQPRNMMLCDFVFRAG